MTPNKMYAFVLGITYHLSVIGYQTFEGVALMGLNSSKLNCIATKFGNVVHTVTLHMCVTFDTILPTGGAFLQLYRL